MTIGEVGLVSVLRPEPSSGDETKLLTPPPFVSIQSQCNQTGHHNKKREVDINELKQEVEIVRFARQSRVKSPAN